MLNYIKDDKKNLKVKNYLQLIGTQKLFHFFISLIT